MRKRPLCMAVLTGILVLWLLPAGIWMEDPIPAGEEQPEFVTGQVCGLEAKEAGQAVCLKHTNLSDTGKILVYLNAEQHLSIGNTLKIKHPFEWKKPMPPGNPGQFDAQLYYQTKKIVLLCYADEATVTDEAICWPGQVLYQIRDRLGKQCLMIFGEKRGSILKAMLLGDRTELAEETKDLYQKSGMSHLLAISGLHISILGMSLYRFLRKLGASYWLSGIPAMLVIFLYGVLTGMGTSTERAVVMCLLAVLADLLGRSYDMLTALAASALLILLQQPLQARNASFLLSFAAVLGIGLMYPALSGLCPVRKKTGQALLASLSIQLFTFPLIQYFYYEIPVYAVLLNLCVIPLMGLLLPTGILSLTVSFLSLRASWLPAILCRAILALYEWLGNGFLQIPGAVWICGKPELWQMAVYYLGIAGFVFRRCRIREKEKKGAGEGAEQEDRNKRGCRFGKQQMIGVLYLLILNSFLLLRFQSGFSFTMLDVGQGDGLFLRTAGGTTCLMDGGSSTVRDVGTYRLEPFLKSQGVQKLDYIFLTHMDGDHISGVMELLEMAGIPGSVSIGTLVLPEQMMQSEKGQELKELAEEKGVTVQSFREGMCLRDKSTEICCLHPGRDESYTDENDASLVLKVTYGNFSLLLTGDLGEEGEEKLLEKLTAQKGNGQATILENCDVLKAGHHGSRASTSEAWLAVVQPKVTLISCGEDNSYGHPHSETLERLKKSGSAILTTPECGAITIRSDGEKFRVFTYYTS